MISKSQLQYLYSLDKPYIKSVWESCEERFKDKPLKMYLKYINLPAYREMTWNDSFGLEEIKWQDCIIAKNAIKLKVIKIFINQII